MTEAGIQKALLLMAALALAVFCLSPFAWMVVVSTSRRPDFLLPGIAYTPTVQHFVDVLTDPSLPLAAYLTNSLAVSTLSAAAATLAAGLSAYAVTRMRFPGRILVPVGVLAFSMFPQISIVGYLFQLTSTVGWTNTYPALILPYASIGVPLALWVMLSAFSRIPVDLDKAALIDGASRLQILMRVVLPLAAPGALSAGLLVFVFSFNEFLFALMLTTDHHARTIPVGIALFEGLHGQLPWGQIMAMAVVSILPVVVLATVFQRRIVQGIVEGAVKG